MRFDFAVHNRRGFTLVEMAFVLLILGLLFKSAILPLGALREHAVRSRAEAQVLEVRESLFAYVIAYGALPCPLPAATTSVAIPIGDVQDDLTVGSMPCRATSGFVPANTLRLAGNISDNGALLDPWGRAYRYTVSDGSDSSTDSDGFWTVPGRAASAGVERLSARLVLCHASTLPDCAGRSIRTDQIAFVVLSTGKDDTRSGLQAENLDNDNYFTVTEDSIVLGAEYDDLLVWGSAADVMYWMLRMGWLP